MKSVAQMVAIFESGPKNTKNVKKMRSPPRLSVPLIIQPKIIMPYGGIPKYYGAPQKKEHPPQHKSPKYIRNVDVNKPPEKIDKEKIKNNMNNMKVLLEKKGINKRPFRIAPPNYYDNQQQDEVFNYNKFLAAKNVFETKKTKAVNNKIYENKPVRKDVKKKAKTKFNE